MLGHYVHLRAEFNSDPIVGAASQTLSLDCIPGPFLHQLLQRMVLYAHDELEMSVTRVQWLDQGEHSPFHHSML